MFETISSEYLNILNEISEFYENNADTEEMTLSKFHMEKDIIENLDLTLFSAKMNSLQMSSVQASILNVIMKSGVSSWDQMKLWNNVIIIIVKFPSNVKIEALQLCMEIVENSIVHDEEFTVLIAYSLEMIKSVSTWTNLDQLPAHTLPQFTETLTRLIQASPALLNVVDLCFQVIEFETSEFITHHVKLLNKHATIAIRIPRHHHRSEIDCSNDNTQHIAKRRVCVLCV